MFTMNQLIVLVTEMSRAGIPSGKIETILVESQTTLAQAQITNTVFRALDNVLKK